MASGINKAVQARDVESVIELYQNRKTPAFGIMQCGAMLLSYSGDSMDEGEQILQQALELYYDSEETAVYSLMAYDTDELNGKKINSKTPNNGSINFRFHDINFPSTRRSQGVVPYRGREDNGNSELLQEVKAMRLELQALKDEQKDTGEEESKLGIVGEIISHPAIEPLMPAIINRFMDWLEGPKKQEEQPHSVSMYRTDNPPGGNRAKISGIPEAALNNIAGTTLSFPAKTAAAIEILTRHIDFCDTIERLALMAEKQPLKFKMYMGMFKSMKL